MKKLFTSLAVLSLVATPVVAEAHDRRGDRIERHDRNRGGLSTGEVIALGVGAAVLGSIISRQSDRLDRRLPHTVDPLINYDPYNTYRPRCIREQVVWRDGFGRTHRTFQYRCNR